MLDTVMKMVVMCFARLVAALSLAAFLLGCGAEADGSGTTVVVGLYPYAYVVDRVGGAHVDTVDLTSAGAEPHDLELTPQQVASVTDADLVVYQRGLQPAVDEAVDQASTPSKLDVADVVAGKVQAAADPHVWLDPTQLATVAQAVADQLAAVDLAHAGDYRANAQAFTAQLWRLDRAYRRGLADCERRVFVTSHAAFGHLADRYGLRMVAIAGIDPHAEPSPARQAQIVDAIRASGVTTIFTEPLLSPAVAESLAEDTGVTVATLDPIEALSADTADADYFSLMRANLAALREANGCR